MTWNSVSCVLCLPRPTPNLLVECRASPPGWTGETPVPPSLSSSWVQCSTLGPSHSPALKEVIDQFARGVIHLHVERFHATGQIVEHHNRRNRHEQSDCGGHKRLGNTARDR